MSRVHPSACSFQDAPGGSVSFAPSWQKKAKTEDAEAQTAELRYKDAETQALERAEAAVQTEEEARSREKEGEDWAADERVREFVAKIGGIMLEELETSVKSQAFDDYQPLEEEGDEEISCKYTLRFDSATHFKLSKALQCTGLSWNATGSMVAVSYGRFDHSGWCEYRAALCMWNIFGNKFQPDKPDVLLETSSGLMCVACHPVQPAVVAAGSFNGEVLVWNVSADDPLVASTKIDDYFHREPILKLEWVYDYKERDYQICSVSADGKVLLWSLKNKLSSPIQGYRIIPKDSHGSRKETKQLCYGGTAVAFPVEGSGQGNFVVGSEGGQVLRCLTKRYTHPVVKGAVKWSKNAESILSRLPESEQMKVRKHVEDWAREQNLREISSANVYEAKPSQDLLFPSPIDFTFQPHVGPVNALEFSPFHRNVFLSCASDGILRVYSLLQTKALVFYGQSRPLRSVEPSSSYLYSACWSRSRPMVLAAGSEDGSLYIYDLMSIATQPAARLTPPSSGQSKQSSSKKPSPVYCCAFNPRVRDFLASGDSRGVVRVWQITWKLANLALKEAALLDKMARAAMEDDEGEDALGA